MLFFKKRKPKIGTVATFNVSLTNTFHARDVLEHLSSRTPLFIEPPIGKQKSYRVQVLKDDGPEDIGCIPTDISKILLTEYPNCKYFIKSHKVTYDGPRVGCDVVLIVRKYD